MDMNLIQKKMIIDDVKFLIDYYENAFIKNFQVMDNNYKISCCLCCDCDLKYKLSINGDCEPLKYTFNKNNYLEKLEQKMENNKQIKSNHFTRSFI